MGSAKSGSSRRWPARLYLNVPNSAFHTRDGKAYWIDSNGVRRRSPENDEGVRRAKEGK